MEKYNNKVFIFLSSLAEFYEITVEHGWEGKLTTKIGKEFNLKNPNRLSLWINRGYIPAIPTAKFLNLNIPETIKTLRKDCKKTPKTPHKAYKSGSGPTIGAKGIEIYGYKFKNKERIMSCIDSLWNIEQLDEEIFAHGEQFLQGILEYTGVIKKKLEAQGSGG